MQLFFNLASITLTYGSVSVAVSAGKRDEDDIQQAEVASDGAKPAPAAENGSAVRQRTPKANKKARDNQS